MSCLRRTGGILAKAVFTDGHHVPPPLMQLVRGIKPRWIPKSKSKIFYVRTPTPIDPEEHEEVRTKYFHYRTKMRAIRKYLKDQNEQKLQMQKQMATQEQDLLAEFQSMDDQINEWNSRVETIREKVYLEEREKHELRSLRYHQKQQAKQQRRSQKALKQVVQDLEDSKSFITLDNLDTEIEKILNLREDYNFAIDKQGNKIEGESILKTQTTQEKQSGNR